MGSGVRIWVISRIWVVGRIWVSGRAGIFGSIVVGRIGVEGRIRVGGRIGVDGGSIVAVGGRFVGVHGRIGVVGSTVSEVVSVSRCWCDVFLVCRCAGDRSLLPVSCLRRYSRYSRSVNDISHKTFPI